MIPPNTPPWMFSQPIYEEGEGPDIPLRKCKTCPRFSFVLTAQCEQCFQRLERIAIEREHINE